MTHRREKIFLEKSQISFDTNHRRILKYNISRYDQAVEKGKMRHLEYEVSRKYASGIKEQALDHLPDYLEVFERNMVSRGVEVLWARDGEEAMGYIRDILEEHRIRLVVKSKSMITEEIRCNELLAEWNIDVVETDLGEFIVQTAGEKPYHILTPAMHKSKEDVALLFHEKFGTPIDAAPEEVAGFVRDRLRKQFAQAGAGITGANFIIADQGGIALTENEGNALMTTSFPRVHIVIAGIERVISSMDQLPFFFRWLAVHGTGQPVSAYNTLLLGSRKEKEDDGPEKMVVILLDNGRSRLIAENEERQALKCIRCGACLNACPIYRNVGGYTYGSTYSGPVGSVITPFYSGFSEYGHLSFACTLCGKCSEVCPVGIPLHELLLLNRKRRNKETSGSFLWNSGMRMFRYACSSRNRMDLASGAFKNCLASAVPRLLGNKRKMPRFAAKSFAQQWKSLNH